MRWLILILSPAIHYYSFWGILILPGLVFALVRFTKTLSVKLEKRADNQATLDQSVDGAYARALEKIYQANQLPEINSRNSRTHPHLYDRLIAAGVTPDYPRPKAPKGMSWIGRLYAITMFVLLGISIGQSTPTKEFREKEPAPPHPWAPVIRSDF